MNAVTLLDNDDVVVRTQITLTKKLKSLVEDQASLSGRSLSEYLRQGAVLLTLVEGKMAGDLTSLARKVIGSVKIKDHPEWKNKAAVIVWQNKMRSEWEN